MKQIALFVLIQIFAAQNLFSHDYFYVSTSNERLKPNLKEKGTSNDEALNRVFKEFGVISYYQSFPGAKNIELRNFYEIHFAENKNIDSFEDLLKNKKVFDAIFRSDYYIPACSNPVSVNDTWIVNNWINNDALNLLDAQCAWSITAGNPNILVGVIDTEFETTHEDLINTFAGVVGTPSYPQNHGTSVSSCVAAGTNNNKGIAGIGYNTGVKGYHVSGTNTSNSLWNNIWQAYQDGIKIINVSWTGIGSYPNTLAVQEMIDNGVVLVVAAGNSPNATDHSAYADIPGVIDVSGVNASNNHGPTGHAHNQWVDVCALSKNVAACIPGNTYGTVSGTSFAAPQVAGVVALIRSVNNSLSPADIENIIKATADPIADANMYPGLLGAGRANAYNAVQAASCATSFTNQTVTSNTIVYGCNTLNVQNVTVTNGAKLTLEAPGEVTFNSVFEVQPGAQLEVVQ